MIVVPDASALITLARIGQLELLRELAEHVRVPEAVYREESEAGLGRPGSRGICAVRLPVRATAPLRRTWVSGTTRSADSAQGLAHHDGEIDSRQYVSSDPETCHGQLRAQGTRVLVTNILDSLAEGSSREEILRSYPSLKPEHIDAAIAYAAELAHEDSLLPLRAE